MTTATLNELYHMHQSITELFDIENVAEVDSIIKELERYGVTNEESLDDAYCGCYPDGATFCEDVLSDIYAEQIEEMPVFLQTAIDWELIWYQQIQYDYFTIYRGGEYYFFRRNF